MRMYIGVVMTMLLANTTQAQGVFETLQAHCGQAFQGRVVKGEEDDPWRVANLVIHIRDCSEDQVKIPLHFNEDRSRIWIVNKLEGQRLRLKHDHRHEDGTPDDVTMYGGETAEGEGGSGDTDLAFIIDEQSLQVFRDNGNTRSLNNVWSMAIKEGTFFYGLARSDLDFKVAFDLSRPVPVPPPAWDLLRK